MISYVLDPDMTDEQRQHIVRSFGGYAEAQGRERRTRLEAKNETRGAAQNAYYWASAIGTIREHMREHFTNDDGSPMDHAPEVWHEYLKRLYAEPQVVEVDGVAVRVYRSTARMTKREFSTYLDRVIDHAAREWHCQIPPPDHD